MIGYEQIIPHPSNLHPIAGSEPNLLVLSTSMIARCSWSTSCPIMPELSPGRLPQRAKQLAEINDKHPAVADIKLADHEAANSHLARGTGDPRKEGRT